MDTRTTQDTSQPEGNSFSVRYESNNYHRVMHRSERSALTPRLGVYGRYAQTRECTDSEFLDLLALYRPYGSLLPLEQVRCLTYVSHPGYTLSEHVLRGDVLTVLWRRNQWVPVFQFLSPRWAPCTRVMAVIRELKAVMSPIDIAYWFCKPCPAISDVTPLQLLEDKPEEALALARALRHFELG